MTCRHIGCRSNTVRDLSRHKVSMTCDDGGGRRRSLLLASRFLRSCAMKAFKRFTPRFRSPVHECLNAQRERGEKRREGASWRRRKRPHVREEEVGGVEEERVWGRSERRMLHCLIHPFFASSHSDCATSPCACASLC